MKTKLLLPILSMCFFSISAFCQDVSLHQQFNGRYDFHFFGNTLNTAENNTNIFCNINTSSFATLNLAPGNQVHKAYLYWAGSGTGDFSIKLNGHNIEAGRTFAFTGGSLDLPYFSAFADVTTLVQDGGNGVYTLSDLNLRAVLLEPLPNHCSNRTNFGGWAIVVIYKNDQLPPNQLNIYDGLQAIPDAITIDLNNINVIDSVGAKIGFIAWEGDLDLSEGERLIINDHEVGNPPLNPPTNAFNGTNSYTGLSNLYNMDLDVYDAEDYITVGDTVAQVRLTSGRDFVLISTIVTKLNTVLPDATSRIDNYVPACGSREIVVDYTISNIDGTKTLPPGVWFTFYADDVPIRSFQTPAPIDFEESWSAQVTLTVPDNIADNFTLTIKADDNNGVGFIEEISEDNNVFESPVQLLHLPEFNTITGPIVCNDGLTSGTFDLSVYEELAKSDPDEVVTFHETHEDAENGINAISNTSGYLATTTPKQIFIRLANASCSNIMPFMLNVRNCPPIVYNYISANNDGRNDVFFIDGLRDIFLAFKLEIYNRWGALIWTGNNNTQDWDGIATKGYVVTGDYVPDGTYYYVLDLNDPDYSAPLTGFLFINR